MKVRESSQLLSKRNIFLSPSKWNFLTIGEMSSLIKRDFCFHLPSPEFSNIVANIMVNMKLLYL